MSDERADAIPDHPSRCVRVLVGESVYEDATVTIREGTMYVEFEAADLQSVAVPLAAAAPHMAGSGEAERYPRVQGRCPACGRTTLFLGAQGYVTCGWIGEPRCPDPTAAHERLRAAQPVAERAPQEDQ